MNAVPLDIPLSLSTEHFQSTEFKTIAAIPYNINIAFDTTKLPLKELDCLVGTNLTIEACRGQPPILNVQWKLVSEGRVVASGASTDTNMAGFSHHRLARYI
jgi:hypothetical protein